MGCGLSRRRQPREASVQSVRPLPEAPSDGEEEETPLLLAVREELCDKAADEPEIHGGSAICPAGSRAFALKVCCLLGLAMAIVAAVVLRFREPLGKESTSCMRKWWIWATCAGSPQGLASPTRCGRSWSGQSCIAHSCCSVECCCWLCFC